MNAAFQVIYGLFGDQGKHVGSSTAIAIDLNQLRSVSGVDYRVMEHERRSGIWPFRKTTRYYVVFQPASDFEIDHCERSFAYISAIGDGVEKGDWFRISIPFKLSEKDTCRFLNQVMAHYESSGRK